jgi:class 3 adenylate cyclase
MNCPTCQAALPEDAAFCGHCGGALRSERTCARCGRSNSPEMRFCLGCGSVLSPASPARAPRTYTQKHLAEKILTSRSALDGERKQVTALFADIKGSMELIEDLDPEEARSIVDPALNLMMEAVHRFGGFVAQSTGDGIFALFGAPLAHEDHPQRALYAALRMQEEIRRYSDRLRAEGRQPLQARVGVNTGEVVMRSVSTGEHAEYVPVGHATSLAARMQVLAPIGSDRDHRDHAAIGRGLLRAEGAGADQGQRRQRAGQHL